jgi:hypothetical protein
MGRGHARLSRSSPEAASLPRIPALNGNGLHLVGRRAIPALGSSEATGDRVAPDLERDQTLFRIECHENLPKIWTARKELGVTD